MRIFEYPYIIITIFVFCFIILAAVGIFFALKGLKTASEDEEKSFANIRKLEKSFVKSGKLREDRCVIYINAYLDNYRSLYFEEQTSTVFADLKRIVFDSFSNGDVSDVAVYGENNFVVYSRLDIDGVRKNIESFQKDITKCLLGYRALNIIEVGIGSFFAFGSSVPFDEAINRAKQAYIFAKKHKLPYAEWDINNGKALEQKIKRENNIEKEIENNRFFLVYQPILNAQTKEIIGAEVLSRLNAEGDGILNPGSFLSAVDSVGINNKFDYYIFEKNCMWISNDKEQRSKYKYTINFSRTTLCEPGFAERIIGIVEKYGLDCSSLVVEILEDKNVAGDAKKQMMDNLSMLRNHGVSFWLDDFGDGCTAFKDLQNFDISTVKIDRSITQNAVTPTGYIILENIIRTAKNIGFKTLCEGVETKEQEEAVIKAGCDLLQGFYYYKPLPVVLFESLFENKSDSM